MARWAYNKDKLPPVVEYLTREGVSFSDRGGRWLSMVCPFHDDTRPSLRVNKDSGAFRCMACDRRGSAIVEIHMQRRGLTFRAAVTDLGAFDGDDDGRPDVPYSATPLDKVISALGSLATLLYALRRQTFNPRTAARIAAFEAARLDFLGELIDPATSEDTGERIDVEYEREAWPSAKEFPGSKEYGQAEVVKDFSESP